MSRAVYIFLTLLIITAPAALASKSDSACGDTQQGIRCSAEKGIAEAQYDLGLQLLNGEGMTRDKMQALQWLSRASDQGHPQATVLLDRLALGTSPHQGCSQ